MYWIIIQAVMVLLLLAGPAWAHDNWLQPDCFNIGLQGLLFIRVLVGHGLKPDKELHFERKMTPRLERFTASGKNDFLDLMEEGANPAVAMPTGEQGAILVAMDRDFSFITLKNNQFSRYLTHEGKLHLIAQMERNPRGEQKERYARCMKTMMHCGKDGKNDVFGTITAQKLEIVLKTDPRRRNAGLSAGVTIDAQVLFDGRPLRDQDVTALRRAPDGSVTEQHTRSDGNGLVCFHNDGPGLWLLRLVHLYPYAGPLDLDWESYWASFCFET